MELNKLVGIAALLESPDPPLLLPPPRPARNPGGGGGGGGAGMIGFDISGFEAQDVDNPNGWW